MGSFGRHLRACNNLPEVGHLVPLRLGGAAVGMVAPAVLAVLAGVPGCARDAAGVSVRSEAGETWTAGLRAVAERLAGEGVGRLRGELFDVRAAPGGAVLAQVDRGMLPPLGIVSEGVHVNGIVRRGDGTHLWVGWRARDKAVAPGQLDNIVAGGIPAGLGPAETLVKEGAEEASLPAALLRTARAVGRVSYRMANAEGTRRDVLHCYDLDVPEGVVPRPGDDEVERFELWPVGRVLEAVRDTETVKFNVNLVLIGLFLREGLIGGAEADALRAGLDAGV